MLQGDEAGHDPVAFVGNRCEGRQVVGAAGRALLLREDLDAMEERELDVDPGAVLRDERREFGRLRHGRVAPPGWAI